MCVLLDTDRLRVLWAIKEQEHLYLTSDCYWIANIRNANEIGLSELRALLKHYGLLRWKGRDWLLSKKGLEKFDRICRSHFAGALPQDTAQCQEQVAKRWKDAIGEISTAMNSDLKQDVKLRSATMKVFWFYQPAAVGMWDTHSARGLRLSDRLNAERTRRKPRNTPYEDFFVERFEAVFEKRSPVMEEMLIRSHSWYPYRRRVLDKYLWLVGNHSNRNKAEQREADVLRKFGFRHLLHDYS